jgi:hypothetical protein
MLAATTEAQAELVRRYARMLRSASALAAMNGGVSARRVGTRSVGRFTRQPEAAQQIDHLAPR